MELDMYSMNIAMILASRTARDEAHSALPNAPVVPYVEKVSAAPRWRNAVAAGLRRLADAVAPARPMTHSAAQSGMRG
jgi:hypothetical protein